jgi:hypothetical protein
MLMSFSASPFAHGIQVARGDENIIHSLDSRSLELWNHRYEAETLRYTYVVVAAELVCSLCSARLL